MTALLAHQLRFDLLALRRNRRMQMFGLALPLVLLVCYAGLFDTDPGRGRGRAWCPPTGRPCPGSSASPSSTSSFMGADHDRRRPSARSGVLKRRRSTPCPAWVLVASRALAATLSSVVACAVMTAVAGWGYGFRLAPGGAVAALLAVVVGSLCFASVAYLVASAGDDARGGAAAAPARDAAAPADLRHLLPGVAAAGLAAGRSRRPSRSCTSRTRCSTRGCRRGARSPGATSA